METVADIVREMRRSVTEHYANQTLHSPSEIGVFANRIEDACLRQVTMRVPKPVTACNGFKMREALESISARAAIGGEFDPQAYLDEIHEIAKDALASPARNCDRFATEEEAYKAWQKSRGWKEDANERYGYGAAWAFTKWLFDTSTPRTGDEGRETLETGGDHA